MSSINDIVCGGFPTATGYPLRLAPFDRGTLCTGRATGVKLHCDCARDIAAKLNQRIPSISDFFQCMKYSKRMSTRVKEQSLMHSSRPCLFT
jgi:hypothetical protein